MDTPTSATESLSSLQAHRQPKIPTHPVVYFLFNGEALVCVGQTDNLTHRLTSHNRKGTITYDTYAYVDATGLTFWQRRDLEAAYIRELQPTANKSHTGRKGPVRQRTKFEPNQTALQELNRLLNPRMRTPGI